MDRRYWHGVYPSMTTPFKDDLSVDYEAVEHQASWLIQSGCSGLVALGSMGEAPALSAEERVEILKRCRRALGDGRPLIADISGLGAAEALALAKSAEVAGCDGVMVPPPHLHAVMSTTLLPVVLHNSPAAYGIDVTPKWLRPLAGLTNLHAINESSGDIRRVTAVREVLGGRLQIFAGRDDVVVESLALGAIGWIAGLANAFPVESARLFELTKKGPNDELFELYEWFLPLLHLATAPKFVELIKAVQAQAGAGSPRVRPPRLELPHAELESALGLIRERLEQRTTTV